MLYGAAMVAFLVVCITQGPGTAVGYAVLCGMLAVFGGGR